MSRAQHKACATEIRVGTARHPQSLPSVRGAGFRSRWRRAFTLMEMLVVLAIITVLMVILFVPLTKSLGLVQRGSASVRAQDSVREAMRRMQSELAIAMQVYEPRPMSIWGYNTWGEKGGHGIPVNAAVPEKYFVPNACIAFRLPRHRYYCTRFGHYVTPADDPTLAAGVVALDTCPRHPGSPLELRPVSPLQPEPRIVAYFVALKNPGLRMGAQNGPPVYENVALFGKRMYPRAAAPGGAGETDFEAQVALPTNPPITSEETNYGIQLNTYALFRAEFNPADPNLANWTLPNGDPNPDFFYDTANAPNGVPFWKNWLHAGEIEPGASITKLMDVDTGDAIKWAESGGKYLPQPLCTFGPSPVQAETAQPNQQAVTLMLGVQNLAFHELAPVEYVAENGHWTGFPANGGGFPIQPGGYPALPPGVATGLIPDVFGGQPLRMANNANANVLQGPRIQVLDGGDPNKIVYDTADTSKRQRLVSYDSITGKVRLAIPRWGDDPDPTYQEWFKASLDPAEFTLDLKPDTQYAPASGAANKMPSSLGSALSDARFSPTVRIVPGSDSVQLVDPSTTPPDAQPLRRAGWSGISDRLDRNVAPTELDTDSYTIDYKTGIINLKPDDSYWTNVFPNGTRQMLVKYEIQTNKPGDVVRIDYSTKELAAVTLGVVEYTRQQDVMPFEVSQRVVIGNMKR